MELIENMVTSDHAILHDSVYTSTKKSLLEITSQDALLDQNKLLNKKIETLIETLNKLPQQLHAMQPTHSSVMQIEGCDICGGVHESSMCMAQDYASKEVNYMANPNRQGFHQGRPLGITSTKIKAVHQSGLPIKVLIFMRGPPS